MIFGRCDLNRWGWIRVLTLILAAWLLVPKSLAFAPYIGLEPSWMISINLALLRKAVFGTEYIYTYGPLGFLYTRVILGQSKWVMVLCDAFIFINLLYIANAYLNSFKRKNILPGALGLIASIIFIQHINCTLSLFAILLFHAARICHMHKPGINLLAGVICVSLLPFIKLNYGLVAIPVFYLAVLILCVQKESRALSYIVPFILLNVALVVFLSFEYRVDLKQYFLSGIYLIKDYNDAVTTELDKSSWPFINYLIVLALYLPVTVTGLFRRSLAAGDRYLALMLIFSLYLSFKNGFVRPDGIHLTGAYIMLPLLGLVSVSACINPGLQRAYMGLHWITLGVCLVFWKSPLNIFGSKLNEIYESSYPRQLLESNAQLSVYNLQVPDTEKINRIKSIVSGQSIDIFPHMVIYAYAAGFNYSPRPVPQSYQPYDVFLDSACSLKFTRSNQQAPAYILFANSAIDNRYPFADESITKRALLENYIPVDTYSLNSFVWQGDVDLAILLKRREAPLHLRFERQETSKTRVDKWIATDTSSALQYLWADINFSFKGEIKRILFQAPRLMMKLRFEDGTEKSYAAIVPILKTGILINQRIADTNDAYTFFSSAGKTNKKIIAVQFYSDEAGMFKPVINVTLKSYSVESNQP